MRLVLRWLPVTFAIVLGALVLSACIAPGLTNLPATPTAQGAEMKDLPDDFHVRYEWYGGTMPPPHHHEYTITVGPGTTGAINYRPNYSTEGVPVWIEPLKLSEEQLTALYNLMLEKKVLREEWPEISNPPVGGDIDWAEITADGMTYALPSFPQDADASAAIHEVYTAIRALVPEATWAKLEMQRQQYIDDYEKKDR